MFLDLDEKKPTLFGMFWVLLCSQEKLQSSVNMYTGLEILEWFNILK